MVSMNRSIFFNNMMASCGLSDLGYQGPTFTLCKKRQGLPRIQVRLDRVLANAAWRALFTEATVKHLPRLHSDHCPILLQCEEKLVSDKSRRPFRFQAMWMAHEDCKGLVQNCWGTTEGSVVAKCAALTTVLRSWNLYTFGNLFVKKRKLQRRILGLQKDLDEHRPHQLECL